MNMLKFFKKDKFTIVLFVLFIILISLLFAWGMKRSAHRTSDQMISSYGKIVSSKLIDDGRVKVWIVEKNGIQTAMYSVSGSSLVFAGVVWNPETGQVVSNEFNSMPAAALQAGSVAPAEAVLQQTTQVSAMYGEWDGEVPDAMRIVDSLSGFKEGNGDIGNTVYIVTDPRCVYCRQAYIRTRPYVARGFTIKWIPTVALGEPEQGMPLAAAMLQSQDPQILQNILGSNEAVGVTPTPESIAAIDSNLEFLYAVFQNNSGQRAGVPAAFFIDHRTKQPRMMMGISEEVVLEDIFGKL